MSRRNWLAAGAGVGAGAAASLLLADRLPRLRPLPGDEDERSPSYWMATIPDLPRFPRLERDIVVDVAVIGGGFTGLATAYYLKQHDPTLRVALLESQRMGSGASSRNSGGVGARFRGHTSASGADRGYELLKQFAANEGVAFDLTENIPSLTLTPPGAPPDTPYLQGEELRQAIGSPFYTSASLRLTNTLHPGKLIAGLVDATARQQVELYEWTPVQRIDRRTPLVLTTPGGTVTARDVVVATNAYTPSLGLARDVITVVHHRVLVTRPLTDAEWEHSGLEAWPLRFEEGGYYTHTVRSTADRRFFFRHVLGHRAFERTDWRIDARARAVGERELLRRYPWLDGVATDYEWHGVTARTKDYWPISGQVDDHLHIAAGYNGSGVMPTHFFGYLTARAILGIPDEDHALLHPPGEHPRMPGELARHVGFHGWMLYRRWRDGR